MRLHMGCVYESWTGERRVKGGGQGRKKEHEEGAGDCEPGPTSEGSGRGRRDAGWRRPTRPSAACPPGSQSPLAPPRRGAPLHCCWTCHHRSLMGYASPKCTPGPEDGRHRDSRLIPRDGTSSEALLRGPDPLNAPLLQPPPAPLLHPSCNLLPHLQKVPPRSLL
jgi:hypothetical protein